MSECPAIPVSKISVNNLTTFAEFIDERPASKHMTLSELGLPQNSEASGKVTRKVRLRLKNSIKAWYSALRYTNKARKNCPQLNGKSLKFVTLTLPAPQFHTDREIKRSALRPFLQRMNRNHNIRRFIWKAEKQKNGNIHFHLLFDEYINFKVLREEWNSDLKRMGYIREYARKWKHKDKDGFKLHIEFGKHMDRAQQYRAYCNRIHSNYSDPNSTDIHNLYSIENIESYMTKYVCKDDESSEVDGKVWDCSESVKKINGFRDQNDYEISELIKLMEFDKRFFKYEDDYFTSYSGPIIDLIFEHLPNLGMRIATHFAEELARDSPELSPPIPDSAVF